MGALGTDGAVNLLYDRLSIPKKVEWKVILLRVAGFGSAPIPT